MMILLAFLLSVDSLLASSALCISRVGPGRQIKLAVAFGVSDGAASLIRGVLDLHGGNVSWANSHTFHLALVLYLLAVYLAWLFEAGKTVGAPFLWTIPVVLSIDNLFGPTVAPVSFGSIAVVVFASASMSLLGFRFGTFLAHVAGKLLRQQAFFRRQTP
jgi:hypothetical protein